MKITQEHYNYMLTAISELDRQAVLTHKSLELGKDKTKRFVWDLFKASNLTIFACDNLYAYLNDAHIETALKNIAKELNYI